MNFCMKTGAGIVLCAWGMSGMAGQSDDNALTEPAFVPDSTLLAHYTFEQANAPGKDASGHENDATVTGRPTTGKAGRSVLSLEGESGIVLPTRLLEPLRRGFTVEFRVRFRQVRGSTNLVSAENLLLLRVDPAQERANLSFFVFANDSWEPRVRTVVPKAGKWYHIAVSWDGVRARVFLDGRVFSGGRLGTLGKKPEAIVVGAPSLHGGKGLMGDIADLRISNQALTDGTFLARTLGIVPPRPKPGVATPAQSLDTRLSQGASGWTVTRDGTARLGPDGMTAMLSADRFIVSPVLDVPAKSARWLDVELRARSEEALVLLFVTTRGARAIPLRGATDGGFHVYTLPAAGWPEWQGRLRRVAIGPMNGQSEVTLSRVAATAVRSEWPDIGVVRFEIGPALPRAGRSVPLHLEIENLGGDLDSLRCELDVPDGVHVDSGARSSLLPAVVAGDRRTLSWKITFADAGEFPLRVRLFPRGAPERDAIFHAVATPAVPIHPMAYVPEPHPIDTDGVLVGAQHCPLWRQGTRSTGWERVVPWPNRKPVLGWYDEGNPEVTDWEITWSLSHGISFFMVCWYRNGQGRPVTPDDVFLEHAIRQGLFHARYRDRFKFAIMWENQRRGLAGVSDMDDLMHNLFPYWLDTFFKHPSYLCIDRKPVLFVYRPENLVRDLGSVKAVRAAAARMGAGCRKAGFDGLWIVGEYRGTDAKQLRLLRDLGCDYVFAYCWPLGNSPSSAEAVRKQIEVWHKRRSLNIIPEVLTVSMGWDSRPWHASPSRWRLTPADFARACSAARTEMKQWPENTLSRRLLLLDNWNEFGEGHYIEPHRQYGFGYLDAVRQAFGAGLDRGVDLTPEDVGLGPYDSLFRKWCEDRTRFRRMRLRKPDLAGAAPAKPDVVAWWRFDEGPDAPVAFDSTGHRLGGILHDIRRVPGLHGRALDCRGGAVSVPASPRLEAGTMTVACWVRTSRPDQNDRWILNRIWGGATDAGYRLGLSKGRPTWAVPLTAWSHHLVASKSLPLDRWVHLAGTCDGRSIRLFMDGVEIAAMPRPGPVKPTNAPLVLGNFAVKHRAYFEGKLDDVRIWDRALSASEIQALVKAKK